jgi:DNA-binding LytR/AlgR family response regulator
MKIAIVDDQAVERERLKALLQAYAQQRKTPLICSEFGSGEEFLQQYAAYRYSAVFLDVFMDGMTGIETAKKIRESDKDTVLFFLTTSESHYSDAFSVFASAYFEKPCRQEELFRALDHFLLRTDAQERTFSFFYSRYDYSIRFSDLVSLETQGNYIAVTDRNGDVFRTRMTFTTARDRLDEHFLTLIKGVIVNMDYIEKIEDNLCYLTNGTSQPINKKKAKELRETWFNYKFAKIRRG